MRGKLLSAFFPSFECPVEKAFFLSSDTGKPQANVKSTKSTGAKINGSKLIENVIF